MPAVQDTQPSPVTNGGTPLPPGTNPGGNFPDFVGALAGGTTGDSAVPGLSQVDYEKVHALYPGVSDDLLRSTLTAVTPAGNVDENVGQYLASIFTMPDNDYQQLQAQLQASGYTATSGKPQPPSFGDRNDPVTRRAILGLVQDGVSGHAVGQTLQDALDAGQKANASALTTQDQSKTTVIPGSVHTFQEPDKNAINQTVDDVARKVLGRKATDQEKATIFAAYRNTLQTNFNTGVQAGNQMQLSNLQAQAGATGSPLLAAAEKYNGLPYQWGGESGSSFDCSGLIDQALQDVGYTAKHSGHGPTADDMFHSLGVSVQLTDLQPGDLLFYGIGHVHHVVIYAGNGMVFNAPHTGANVRLDPLSTSELAGVKRIPGISQASSAGLTGATDPNANVAVPGGNGVTYGQLGGIPANPFPTGIGSTGPTTQPTPAGPAAGHSTKYSPTEMYSLMMSAGATPAEARSMVMIGMAESGGDITSVNTNTKGAGAGSHDVGIWQINDKYNVNDASGAPIDFGRLKTDPVYNAQVALGFLRSRGLDDWSSHKVFHTDLKFASVADQAQAAFNGGQNSVPGATSGGTTVGGGPGQPTFLVQPDTTITTQQVDPNADAEAKLRAANPVEAGAHDLAGAYDMFHNMLKGL